MVYKLRIHSWNANGIRNKTDELKTYIRQHDIDVMFISELKLQNSLTLKIPNYTAYFKPRPGSRFGGVGVIIKKEIPHSIGPNVDSTIEHICLNVAKKLTLVGVYNRPSNDFTDDCLNNLLIQNKQVLIIGDLNATHAMWNCNRNNQNGQILFSYLDNTTDSFLLHTTTPTHFPTNGMTPTTIDLAISKNLAGITNLETHSELPSDHNPVFLHIHYTQKQNVTRTVTTYKHTNWVQYRQLMDKKTTITPDIRNTTELEMEVQTMTATLQEAQSKIAKKVKTKHDLPLPDEILDLIKVRNRFRKIWQRTGIRDYQTRTKDTTKLIRTKIYNHKNQTWERKLQSLSTTDNSLWKLGKVLKAKANTIPAITKHGQTYITDIDKANLLADTFEEIHRLPDDTTQEQKDITKQLLTRKTLDIDNITQRKLKTTPGEVYKIIKLLPNNKAPGKDGIDYKLIKNLPRKCIVQFTYIINAILLLQHWPTPWKEAVVVPIAKTGKNPGDYTSYRPISLLSTLSKVAEKIILKRLNELTSKLNLPDKTQFGFKTKHNTTHQVARIVTDIIHNYKKGKNTTMVLLDIEKAFDKVWTAGLISKLTTYKYPQHIINLIHSYLTNRTMYVKINNAQSDPRVITAGVPQGSVLGPTLFNIFISDLPTFHNSNLALFADDTALYAHSYFAQAAGALTQCHLDRVMKFYIKWKVQVNVNKSEAIVFSRKFTNNKMFRPLRVGNMLIPQKSHVKYLGVQLDSRLRFGHHLKTLHQKLYTATRYLYPLLAKKSALNQRNKKLLYTVMLRPIITYASPVWMGVSKTALRPLQSYQNKMLRLITNKDRYTKITELHQLTDIPTLREHIQELGTKFYRDLEIHDNEYIQRITATRHDTDITHKHPLPYAKLPTYQTHLYVTTNRQP